MAIWFFALPTKPLDLLMLLVKWYNFECILSFISLDGLSAFASEALHYKNESFFFSVNLSGPSEQLASLISVA